ncbi:MULTISPECIES: hypothetical protein [unclassified Streptomyces]|uniref:hypothetical protein n=1 Tax=unclassified Streptomyces TaxID=2593676 RepID=UPI001CB73D95|nr:MULTISPECIES: hypothetical protein [unclassified Streptomyces]
MPTAEPTIDFADTVDFEAPADWALVRVRTEQADDGWAVDGSEAWSTDGRMPTLAWQAHVVQDAPAKDAPSATAALQGTS